MNLKIYERKTIGGTWFAIYVTENKNENLLKVEDRLNKKEIAYEISDAYILKLIRILESSENGYADGFEMANVINRKCRNLNIDLSWSNWVVEL